MAGPGARLTYTAAQSARIAWFFGHYVATLRRMGPAVRPGETPIVPSGPVPNRTDLTKSMRNLFARDWRNIDAGHYLAPETEDLRWFLKGSRDYLADLTQINERRATRINDDVPDAPELPRYYRQNFHYQTDGWLSRKSAERYDFQVETLFTGAADAMRRLALPHIRDIAAARDQRTLHLVDIACGTGRFTRKIKRNFPRLSVTGIDLSEPYLELAAETLCGFSRVNLVNANAENMPLPDDSVDIATSIYLFHELPPKIRAVIAGEIARILKPGGRLIFVDSLQYGDTPDWDGLLDYFPVQFHEPYYSSYVKEDLGTLFDKAGLAQIDSDVAFLSKITVYEKPA